MEKLNNKKLGNKFEKDFMDLLAKKGYWVTFLEGKANIGSQPCDIIAIRRDNVELYDCKTLANKNGLFPISRIEENQRLAFERLRIEYLDTSPNALSEIIFSSKMFL